MAAHRKWTDADLERAVRSSTTMAGVVRRVGLKISGNVYPRLREHIDRLGLSTDHFLGQASGRGGPPRRPVEDYLIKRSKAGTKSHDLKLRLIEEGLKKHQCEVCERTRWGRKPIPLELHHVNGDRKDNRLDNLCLLCPNCHAQTPNYRARKLKRR